NFLTNHWRRLPLSAQRRTRFDRLRLLSLSAPSNHRPCSARATFVSKRVRLDVLLTERGLVESREQARRLIMAGAIVVNEQRVDKPGTFVDTGATCRVKDEARSPYVSRGGQKLEAALRAFHFDVTGVVAVDVGASTGGF